MAPASRTKTGKYKKGHSGNPKGRPPLIPEGRKLLKEHGPNAIAKIVELLNSDNDTVALKAAIYLADQAYGRAKESVDIKQSEEVIRIIAAPQSYPKEA